MWKLKIIQKRKSTESDYIFEEKVEFVGKDLEEMCEIVENLTRCEDGKETIYRIENMKEGEK